MLIESQVVDAVCRLLSEKGFAIVQRLPPTKHGVDIIARSANQPPTELWVEAKGATSERKGSKRFGKPFDSAQVNIHVAEAFYTAAKHVKTPVEHGRRIVAIALPSDVLHRRYVAPIQPALDALSIGVLWVEPDDSVKPSPEGFLPTAATEAA
jgi:hypothetical protein